MLTALRAQEVAAEWLAGVAYASPCPSSSSGSSSGSGGSGQHQPPHHHHSAHVASAPVPSLQATSSFNTTHPSTTHPSTTTATAAAMSHGHGGLSSQRPRSSSESGHSPLYPSPPPLPSHPLIRLPIILIHTRTHTHIYYIPTQPLSPYCSIFMASDNQPDSTGTKATTDVTISTPWLDWLQRALGLSQYATSR